jgi:glycosyltransferase involved in cell wall biosynthesis
MRLQAPPDRPKLCFVVESGTDVRMVTGLASHFDLSLLLRRPSGDSKISQTWEFTVPASVGPSSPFGFARLVFDHLRRARGRLDFVIVQGYGPAALAANLACKVSRIPSAMLICSPTEAYYRCRRTNRLSDKPFRRKEVLALELMARLNAVVGACYIVLSQYLANVVRRHSALKPVHIIPIYGVDTSVFVPPPEPRHVMKRKRGLPTSGSLIFFSSRIAPEKDVGTLFAAAQILLASGRDIWLLNRSGGHKIFAQEARRAGIGERVLATDAVHPDELPQDYQASDVCVQASREEGLGFSVLEAMACGSPVVASNVGGLHETVQEGRTGWLYPVGDADVLAKCIAATLDNPQEGANRAAAGRELVQKSYERNFVFEQLSKVVQQECSGRGAEQ